MRIFKTFVASSLKEDFKKDRDNIKNILKAMSSDKELDMDFTTYRFEEDGCNTVYTEGAQNNINSNIDECHAFILICDDNIGKKTLEEFEYALERCKKGKSPYFITILKKKGNGEPPNEHQILFKNFEAKDIKFYYYGTDGKVHDDKYTYEYEYEAYEKKIENLKYNIKKWILDNWPVLKAETGRDIEPKFLYNDKDRKKFCIDRIYFRRDIDDDIDDAMLNEHKQILMIKGSTLSGKTRALYQAIKKCPDAFFYKFEERRGEKEIKEEIDEITRNINLSTCKSPLYIIFEDVHQLPTDYNTKVALESLRLAIQDKNIHIIMTSTITDAREEDTFLKPDVTLTIQPLSANERFQVMQFCKRNDIPVTGNKKAIGAMLIDLGAIADLYNEFLNKEKEEQKRWAKESLLQAVKAFSIWHNTNLGEVKGLYSLTKFLLKTQVDITDDSIVYKAFKDFKKLSGINDCSNGNNFKIDARRKLPEYFQIEEYIYREILSFSGGVCRGDSDNSLEDELELIGYILKFVDEGKKESIIVCLAKLARRAEHKDEIAPIIYNLVTEIYTPDYKPDNDGIPSDWKTEPWYNLLKRELADVKKYVIDNPNIDVDTTAADNDVTKNLIYLSKIIRANLVFAHTFDEAYEIFRRAEGPLQSMSMLGVLIEKCKDKVPEQMEKNFAKLKEIDKLEQDEIKNSYYIINKILPYYKDFPSAFECFNRGIHPYMNEEKEISDSKYHDDATKLRKLKLERRELGSELVMKEIALNQMTLALNELAKKIEKFEELMQFIEIIRKNYVMIIDNLDMANSFIQSADIYNRDSLTLVDMLATLRLHGLQGAISNLFDWNDKSIPEGAIDFVDRVLIPQFISTLNNKVTPRYKAKHTVATILNLFIEKCCECRYDDVMEQFFNKMEIEWEGRIINMRDSYTYARVLENKNCKYIDALNLYYNYIKPHSLDPNNHFTITRFIMNAILGKVNSESSLNEVIKLFEENNVRQDTCSSNKSLSNLDYETCVNEVIPKMITKQIDFDMYTLGELISKAPNVKVAVGFFKPLKALEIKSDDAGIPKEAKEKVQEMIDFYTSDTDKFTLEEQHYFWAMLVSSHCRNDEDRKVLHDVLNKFLESEKIRPRIFNKDVDKGIIYNNCLRNTSFIRNYKEAKDFISSKGVEVDDYTFTFLQKFIVRDYKGKELESALNALYEDHKELVMEKIGNKGTYFYNKRLEVYSSQQETLNLKFIKPDSKVESKALTPLGYIRYLKENGLPFDVYTMLSYSTIKQGYTQELLNELINFIHDNDICLNYRCIDNLHEGSKKCLSKHKSQEFLQRLYQSRIEDKTFSKARAAVKIYSYNLQTLEEAFSMVEGNDLEKLYNYTQLFTAYRKKHSNDKSAFERCMKLYSEYIEDKITPNSDILSCLANLAKTRRQLEQIFDKMEKKGVKAINYIITPIMRVSKDFKDAKDLLERYYECQGNRIGNKGTEREVDAVLHGLVEIWKRNKSKDILLFINDLKEAVLNQGYNLSYAEYFPCLNIYVTDGGNLTQNALCELVNCWPCTDGDKDVKKQYINQTTELMKRFYKHGNDDINERLITALKYVAKKISISNKEILNLLFPYPRLAFRFACSLDKIYYNEYKVLVESWNAGFDKLTEDYAVDTLVNCLKKINGREVVDNIIKHWENGISVAHFLKVEDVKGDEYKKLTFEKDDNAFRRIRKKIEFIKNGHSVDDFIIIYNDELYDSQFLKFTLEELSSVIKPKFDDMKRILDYVSKIPDCANTVLCSMANKIRHYNELLYVIEFICTNEVDTSPKLARCIILSIIHKRYDDNDIRSVSEQMLEAVNKDILSFSDLLKPEEREKFNKPLSLSDDCVAICELLYKMSHYPDNLSSTELQEYLEGVVSEYYKDGYRNSIDSYVVQEFISQYTRVYNKQEKQNPGQQQENNTLNNIKSILSTKKENCTLDFSNIFSQQFKDNVNCNDYWYKIKSVYISDKFLEELNPAQIGGNCNCR